MKAILTFLLSFSFVVVASAQQDEQLTVELTNNKTIKGSLKVLNSEGVGLEDLEGNYYAIKANRIKTVVAKKRKLSIVNFAGYYYFRFYPGVKVVYYGKEMKHFDWAKLESMAKITNDETLLLSQELGITAKYKNYVQRLQVKGDYNYFRDHYYDLQSFLDEKFVYESLTEGLRAASVNFQ